MTFLDMIEMYNIQHDRELNDIGSMFEDIDIDTRLDKDVLVGALLDECGAMRCLYETTPTFKYFSDNFFKKYKWNITKLWDTMEFEYDPLKNKQLEWTEETDITQDLDTEEERTRDNTGTQDNGYEETNTVSAMNSNTYTPDNKTTSGNTRTDNLSESINATKGEDLTWDETDTHTESGTVNTAYQDLITKERKVTEFNIYNWISKKYASELFLLIY